MVGTEKGATFHGFISHEVDELQRAFLALHVRNFDSEVVRGVGSLEEGGLGGVIVRNVIRKDHLNLLVLVQDGQAEGRADVGNTLFPCQGQGAGLEGPDAVHPVHAGEGPASTVFVAGVVEGDVLAFGLGERKGREGEGEVV